MSLSKRLLCVADLVPEGAYIADVGSDHAQLPLFLLAEGKIPGAEAIENKPGPYLRMAKAVGASPFADRIVLSLSDGLAELVPPVDTLVLAGMGGRLILKILKDHPEKLEPIKTIVVDAHEERPLVIRELGRLSYRLGRAAFFFDEGIAYDVMRFEKAEAPIDYSPKECLFGPTHLTADPGEDFRQYWSKEEERYAGLLKASALPEETRADYQRRIALIKEVLHEH
jgi:tRNA (adenine22-N1)-methyltransferase